MTKKNFKEEEIEKIIKWKFKTDDFFLIIIVNIIFNIVIATTTHSYGFKGFLVSFITCYIVLGLVLFFSDNRVVEYKAIKKNGHN